MIFFYRVVFTAPNWDTFNALLNCGMKRIWASYETNRLKVVIEVCLFLALKNKVKNERPRRKVKFEE